MYRNKIYNLIFKNIEYCDGFINNFGVYLCKE